MCQFQKRTDNQTLELLHARRLLEVGALRSAACTKLVSNGHNSRKFVDLMLAFRPTLRYQSAMSKDAIENLARMLGDSLPDGLRTAREDLESNFRGVLQTGLGKLDLVTREEFEVQEAVLLRTREKLEALERKLDALEKES